ncbi:unnamed protein product, partial [Prorocentrum cordatum]
MPACARARDSATALEIKKLATAQDGATLSDASFCLLVKACQHEPKRVSELFQELAESGRAVSQDVAVSLVAACMHTGSISLADRVFEHLKPAQPLVLSAFVRFYIAAEKFDRACDIYEQACQGGDKLSLDSRSERSLMSAAMRCGRGVLAQGFLDRAPSDIAKHVAMIRNCASEGNLKGATTVSSPWPPV